jgi:geranyl-CoA carboxylase alpha subunit
MNTRLQVEHPVTELVTGLDLVELQIRVARGEPLPLQQADVELRGHAVEVRLCAESPADEFLPGSGPVIDWSAPAGVRCDHALATGSEVTAWYDSMVAKLVAHAATREQALSRLADALDHTVLLGLQSNRVFLARVLRHPEFVAGRDVSTAFIGRNFATGASRAAEPDARTWALAAWLSVAAAPEALATEADWRHWTNGRALPMPWRLRRTGPAGPDEQHGKVFVSRSHAIVETAAARHEVVAQGAAPGSNARAVVDGQSIEYRYGWDGDTLWLYTPSADHAFVSRRREPARSAEAGGASAAEVRATINARVLQVVVAAGSEVARGDRLVVLEAMKMEHEVRAARPGRIAEVGVKVGDQVVPGQALVRYAGDT